MIPDPVPSRMGALLCPHPPRQLRWTRPVQVLLRTLHIASMALVLGGYAFGIPRHEFRTSMLIMVFSGLGLLAVDLWKSGLWLVQGSGVAFLLKAGLLGAGLRLFPEARFPWYLAATLVASIGSHMPRSWRHFSFLHGRVLEPFENP